MRTVFANYLATSLPHWVTVTYESLFRLVLPAQEKASNQLTTLLSNQFYSEGHTHILLALTASGHYSSPTGNLFPIHRVLQDVWQVAFRLHTGFSLDVRYFCTHHNQFFLQRRRLLPWATSISKIHPPGIKLSVRPDCSTYYHILPDDYNGSWCTEDAQWRFIE